MRGLWEWVLDHPVRFLLSMSAGLCSVSLLILCAKAIGGGPECVRQQCSTYTGMGTGVCPRDGYPVTAYVSGQTCVCLEYRDGGVD